MLSRVCTMTSIDVLLSESRFTMEELRQEREVLMTTRMELIERHKKLSRRIMVQPFLTTARAPTPPSIEKSQSYDNSWVNSIVTGLVYDAVREVDVSRPYRKKAQFYATLSNDYEKLIGSLISKSIKQTITSEIYDMHWGELLSKEIKIIVKQCIGDVDVAESLASTLILMAISKTNAELNSAAPGVPNEFEITKNLMMEFCLERNKRKTERYFHKLNLQPLLVKREVNADSAIATDEPLSRENTDLVFDGETLSATRMFDIQCIDKVYLPYKFEEYSVNEIWLWKNVKIDLLNITQSSNILAMAISPTSQLAAISIKNYLIVMECETDTVLYKTSVEVRHGDCKHIAWCENELEIITTTATGNVLFWSFFNQSNSPTASTPGKAPKVSKQVSAGKSMFLRFEFSGTDLRLSQGPFAQQDDDRTVKHVPVKTFPAPLFTICGEQPVFYVVCENNEILRVQQSESSGEVLCPSEMPLYDEIKNCAEQGLKFDIFKGHNFKIVQLVFKDEYTFYSFDEQCFIIEWEYSRTNYDAYGYVIPKKFVVIGNDVDHVRLVKNVKNCFNTKDCKTRQEALQAAKTAEKLFSDMGFGKKSVSSRENTENGLMERTFVSSVNESQELEVKGVVVVRKVLGRALFSMKSRIFKLKNCKPTRFLGLTISPCQTLIAYCFLFSEPLYSVQPFLSVLILRVKGLCFLNNKIKVPLTKELVDTLQNDEESFSFCLSPPHYLSKAAYMVIKINKSMLAISTATSNILRTTLDLQSYSSDSIHFFNEKNIATIQGAELKCEIWKSCLLIYGSVSKQVLSVYLTTPDFTEDEEVANRKLFYANYSKFPHLVGCIDPDNVRLLVKSNRCWGKVYQSDSERRSTLEFLRGVTRSLDVDPVRKPDQDEATE